MKTALLLAPVLFASTLTAPLAAQSGKILDKVYPANGRPDLQLAVDNSAVHATSCGGCREVRIHVDTRDRNLSDFRLQESQTGNLIRFSFKEPPTHGWHIGGYNRQQPEITVQLPADSNVKLEASNGAISLAGVSGNVEMHTDNGALELSGSRGGMHLSTSNGRITLSRVQGDLQARTDNGRIEGDGRFASIDARTDNGAVHLAALPGSPLNGGVHVKTDNGSVELRVPRGLRTDVDLRTDLGAIRCNLPLAGQNTGGEDRHHVHGAVNGGGTILRVATDNGSITVDGE